MRYEGTTTTTTTDGWMVYGHDTFFHWVLVHQLKLTGVGEGSKIEVHPIEWPQNGKVLGLGFVGYNSPRM